MGVVVRCHREWVALLSERLESTSLKGQSHRCFHMYMPEPSLSLLEAECFCQ